MAGNNICIAIQGHLLKQQRPFCLQPMDVNRNYCWMEDNHHPGGSGREWNQAKSAYTLNNRVRSIDISYFSIFDRLSTSDSNFIGDVIFAPFFLGLLPLFI